MGAALSLSQPELVVEPGQDTPVEVEVRSTTAVVDHFELQVLGPAAAWATVEPAALSLFPGARGTATVTFAVPRTSAVEAGTVPFAVKATSLEDQQRPVVEEGTLVVRPYADLVAELAPRTSRGVRRGRHEVAVDNYGNTPMAVRLSAVDPDVLLKYAFEPPELVVEPGVAAFAHLKVRPRRPLWRGQPQARPFQLVATVAGLEPVRAEGLFLQQPRIPPWFAKLLVLVVLLAAGLALLWVAVLKPTLKSTAKEAVMAPLAEQAAETADLANKTSAAGIGVPGSALESIADSAGSGAIAGTLVGDAYGVRLAVDGPGTVENSVAVPKGKVFALSDIVFQNPAGDSGAVQLQRDGEVLLRNNLANFRDLDFHFLSPITFEEGRHAVLHVECAAPAPAHCTPAAYLAGKLKDKAPGATTTTTVAAQVSRSGRRGGSR